MRTIHKCLFVVIAISCLFINKISAQIIPDSAYHIRSTEHYDMQKLINGSVTRAENMLVKQGAYTPYAAALTFTDSIIILDGYADTKGKTLTHELEDLKTLLKAGADKGRYKAIVVYFDVTVTDPDTKLPTDAIAAFTEHSNINGTCTFYFPYKKTEQRTITYSRTISGDLTDSEIFTKVGK